MADPELVALMVMTTLESLAHRCTLYPPQGRTLDDLVDATTAMLVAYIARA